MFNIFFLKLFRLFSKLYQYKLLPFSFSTPLQFHSKHLQGNKFLGYRLVTNVPKLIFFSQIKTWRLAQQPQIHFATNFRRLFIVDQDQELSSLLRVYYKKYFFLPNRDPKITNFFRLFYTWHGYDIAYFFHYNVLLVLIRLGLAYNLKQSASLVYKKLVYFNGSLTFDQWLIIEKNTTLMFLYSVPTLFFLSSLRKKLFAFKRKLIYLYWTELRRLRKQQQAQNQFYMKKKQYNLFIYGTYPMSYVNICFLSLTVNFWKLPQTHSQWFWYSWINWLNFSTHFWKYIS